MKYEVITGLHKVVLDWLEARLDMSPRKRSMCATLGVLNENRHLICGILYSEYLGHDIRLDIAADDPRWCQRHVLRSIFHYPFEQLGCARVTGIQPASHTVAHRLVEGLGFRREGVLRLGWNGHEDAWLYGMIKSECRWIQHGQQRRTKATFSDENGRGTNAVEHRNGAEACRA